MAPQKEFESPTFRLGGGRSILLSYWGMCGYYSTQINCSCQENTAHFFPPPEYTVLEYFERSNPSMYYSDDPNADLDDLIFEEDAGGPSER